MDDEFNQLATDKPDRGDETEEEDVPNYRSATEAENTSPNDSDLESILKKLFPYFNEATMGKALSIASELNTLAPTIMLGRVFPDNFSNKVYLIVTSIALKHYNDPDFDVVFTIMIVEGLCQIGLEGKGRVEAVIVSGNTKEQAEQESNKMGNF